MSVQYHKDYYIKHREYLTTRRKDLYRQNYADQFVMCECGKFVQKTYLSNHMQTTLHITRMNLLPRSIQGSEGGADQ